MTFTRSDWTLFRSLTTLPQKAGTSLSRLAPLVMKELVDNALDAGALFRARMADDDAQMEALASHAHRQGRARATDGAARALLDGILAVGLFALMLAGGCAVAGLAEFVSRLAAPEG